MQFVSGPPTRAVTVLAQDPSVQVSGKALTATVPVPAESLAPGPKGHRIHVIDYDATRGLYFEPRANGLGRDAYAGVTDVARLVADRHFHAQNVYALVATTLLQFEMALGRRVSWGFESGAHHIKVAPHAFAEANAYYSRRDEGIVFGYVPMPALGRGRGASPFVFTCLSSDIVVHETTHALVDGLRAEYMRPSTPDQPAFHEGFADIVALLSSLSRKELIALTLPRAPHNASLIDMDDLEPEALKRNVLLGLAEQFGRSVAQQTLRTMRSHALKRAAQLNPRQTNYDALRRSVELDPKTLNYLSPLARRAEAHDLGELPVAALMNAFLAIWTQRCQALAPIPGRAQGRNRFADRDRVAEEGAKAAEHLLRIAVRAIDYMPPINITFPDFLSALLTADHEAMPDDSRHGYRERLCAAFATYGIDPAEGSTAEGHWKPSDGGSDRLKYGFAGHSEMGWDREAMMRFIWENRERLEIDTDAFTKVNSVRPVMRVSPDGFVLRETVAEYFQLLDLTARDLKAMRIQKPRDMPDTTPVRLLGGGTLIFDDYGRLKFHIGTGVRSKRHAAERLAWLWAHGETGHDTDRARRFERMHRLRASGGGTRLTAGW